MTFASRLSHGANWVQCSFPGMASCVYLSLIGVARPFVYRKLTLPLPLEQKKGAPSPSQHVSCTPRDTLHRLISPALSRLHVSSATCCELLDSPLSVEPVRQGLHVCRDRLRGCRLESLGREHEPRQDTDLFLFKVYHALRHAVARQYSVSPSNPGTADGAVAAIATAVGAEVKTVSDYISVPESDW
jgi:hypothetical protein